MDSSLVPVPQPLSSIYTVHPSLLETLSFPGFLLPHSLGFFLFLAPSLTLLAGSLSLTWILYAGTPQSSILNNLFSISTFSVCVCVCARVSQSCPTLCDPMDCSPPHSSIQGILQARILEWVAIPFSKGSSQPRDRTWVSCIAGRFFTVWAPREAHTSNTAFQKVSYPGLYLIA